MKPQNLMIGDYIMFNGSPYIVEELSEKGWMHMLDFDTHTRVQMTSDYIFDHIEGIVMTEEFLLKNGFKREYVLDTTHFINEDRRLVLQNDTKYLNSDSEWYIHIDSADMSTVGSAEFTYVHEFQHILELFKFDIKLTL